MDEGSPPENGWAQPAPWENPPETCWLNTEFSRLYPLLRQYVYSISLATMEPNACFDQNPTKKDLKG